MRESFEETNKLKQTKKVGKYKEFASVLGFSGRIGR